MFDVNGCMCWVVCVCMYGGSEPIYYWNIAPSSALGLA